MKNKQNPFSTTLSISWIVLLLPLLLPSMVVGQHQEVVQGGEIEYHQHCAVCHGAEGRGNGVMAKDLTLKPADLTQLARRNGGVFPFWSLYRTIDGRELVRGHGSREMPVWGRRFIEEAGASGPLQENLVKGRILGLIFYLQSIQQ